MPGIWMSVSRTSYDWPGNARELRNVVERATMLAESSIIGPVDLDLPAAPSAPMAPDHGLRSLGESEKHHIERVLVAVGGSRTRAAEILGISRSTLWDKLKRYGLAR